MTAEHLQGFGKAMAQLDALIDWPLLEREYCWDEGAGFFDEERRQEILDVGLQLAGAVAEQIGARVGDGGVGRSLYVGAAVAELAPMLCERIVLGREVVAVNLPCGELEELNRALALVPEARGLQLTTGTPGVDVLGPFDHLWIVSVVNDPEAFPALHDLLYERTGELATGRGDLEAETRSANALIDRVLSGARAPGLLTTTDEESELIGAGCERAGFSLEVPSNAILSPIVGDPVRICGLALR